MRSEWRSVVSLATVMFLGEREDIVGPDRRMLVAGRRRNADVLFATSQSTTTSRITPTKSPAGTWCLQLCPAGERPDLAHPLPRRDSASLAARPSQPAQPLTAAATAGSAPPGSSVPAATCSVAQSIHSICMA